MNCTECLALINPYLDGELEEQSQTEIESHVAGCFECSYQVASLQVSLHRLRKTFPDQRPSAALWEKIRARTRTR
jgi:anti-sigma factor RsiW